MDPKYADQFKLFARLKSEKKLLEQRLDELQPVLLQAMLDAGGMEAKVPTDLGNFTVKKMKVWTYPESIVEKETEIKKEKLKAQQTGLATYEVSPSLYFRLKGEEE